MEVHACLEAGHEVASDCDDRRAMGLGVVDVLTSP